MGSVGEDDESVKPQTPSFDDHRSRSSSLEAWIAQERCSRIRAESKASSRALSDAGGVACVSLIRIDEAADNLEIALEVMPVAVDPIEQSKKVLVRLLTASLKILRVTHYGGKCLSPIALADRRPEEFIPLILRRFRRHEGILKKLAFAADQGVEIAIETRTTFVEDRQGQVNENGSRLAYAEHTAGALVFYS